MDEIWRQLQQLLGLNADEFNWYQMALRAVVIYVAALAMVRVGEKRFLGKNTAFDVILGVILGSVASRAINGTSALLGTIVAGFMLVTLHWLIAVVSFRSDRFGTLVKGSRRQLVTNGQILWDEMRGSHISEDDLMSQIRVEGKSESLDKVEKAFLERSGQISIIPVAAEPKVVEIAVEEGVQTVRIQFETG